MKAFSLLTFCLGVAVILFGMSLFTQQEDTWIFLIIGTIPVIVALLFGYKTGKLTHEIFEYQYRLPTNEERVKYDIKERCGCCNRPLYIQKEWHLSLCDNLGEPIQEAIYIRCYNSTLAPDRNNHRPANCEESRTCPVRLITRRINKLKHQ